MNTEPNESQDGYLRNGQTLDRGLLFACMFGSRAHGTAVGRSDVDVRGVFAVPSRILMDSFSPESKLEAISRRGDVILHEARKFVHMALSCNPNVLEVLWAPEDCILHRHPAWKPLRDARDGLLSRRVGIAYGGFAKGEFDRLSRIKPEDIESNPEIAYRYHKALTHVLRLLRMAHEALRGEGLLVRRHDAPELLLIKNGITKPAEVLQEIRELDVALKSAVQAGPLRADEPVALASQVLRNMLALFEAMPPVPPVGQTRTLLDMPPVSPSSRTGPIGPMGRMVVLDLEGAGNTKGGADIVEIGAVELIDGALTGRSFHSLVKPDHDPNSRMVALHGLDAAALVGAPRFPEAFRSLADFLGESPIVAHSASSDRAMLTHDLAIHGMTMPDNKWFCTERLGRAWWNLHRADKPQRGNVGLETLCAKLGVDMTERANRRHGAMLDARMAAACLLSIAADGVDITAQAWAVMSPKPGPLPRTLPVIDRDGRFYAVLRDGTQMAVPEHPADTHVAGIEGARWVVRSRDTNESDNPLGPCIVFCDGDQMSGIIKDADGSARKVTWEGEMPKTDSGFVRAYKA